MLELGWTELVGVGLGGPREAGLHSPAGHSCCCLQSPRSGLQGGGVGREVLVILSCFLCVIHQSFRIAESLIFILLLIFKVNLIFEEQQ